MNISVENGRKKIQWAKEHMPILAELEKEFIENKPLRGKKVSISVHVEAKTARLALLLAAGGADVYLTGCNPLSTQDDVAAALTTMGINVHCKHGVSSDEYVRDLKTTLECNPHIIIDDGGDLTEIIHSTGKLYSSNLLGICEETTTGVSRLKILEKNKKLKFPAFAVNNAQCKNLFDNRYGTGQSVMSAIMSTTNLVIAGKNFVVAGYGLCGKGVALRAKGMGAKVIVTEIDPIKALEAHMDGFSVTTMDEAAKIADYIVTLTGCNDVVTSRHYSLMKDCVILANAGHFDVEINLPQLEDISVSIENKRENIEEYTLANGKRINVLASGRLVNLASGDGHPAEIMDMSFAIQALCACHILQNEDSLENKTYDVPEQIDVRVANILLKSKNMDIDKLTKDQENYINNWTPDIGV